MYSIMVRFAKFRNMLHPSLLIIESCMIRRMNKLGLSCAKLRIVELKIEDNEILGLKIGVRNLKGNKRMLIEIIVLG